MVTRSLHSRRHPLSATAEQIRTLQETDLPDFESRLTEARLPPLKAGEPRVLQVNIGYMCNQTCRHCHVDAGPDRKERMSLQVMDHVLDWLRTGLFHTLDITGGAPEMHADALEALYTHTPGLKVVLPATAADAKGLLSTSIRSDDPILFLEPIRGYRLIKDEVPETDFQTPLGKLRVHREGSDVTIVAWSAAVHMASKAAEILATREISVEILDLRSLVPLDIEGLIASVMKTGRCVVVQESPLTSGFAGEIAATIQEEAFFSLLAPIIRVAAPDTPYPVAAVEHFYVPGVERICEAVALAKC